MHRDGLISKRLHKANMVAFSMLTGLHSAIFPLVWFIRSGPAPVRRLTYASQESPVDQDDMDYYGMVLANLINGKAYTNEKRSCIRRGGPCDHRPNDCCPKSCKCCANFDSKTNFWIFGDNSYVELNSSCLFELYGCFLFWFSKLKQIKFD